jgi:hypothetical protein
MGLPRFARNDIQKGLPNYLAKTVPFYYRKNSMFLF